METNYRNRSMALVLILVILIINFVPTSATSTKNSTGSKKPKASVATPTDLYGDFEYYAMPDGSVWICGYQGTTKEVVIPSRINDCDVTGITGRTFRKNLNIESVVMPDTVTMLGRGAFKKCENLKKVVLSEGITEIKDGTFYKCINLMELTIPCGALYRWFRSSPFKGCKSLIKITLLGDERISYYNLRSLCYESSNLTTIEVDDANKYYCSLDGVLFNKTATKLIIYPRGKNDKKYVVPNGVRRIKGLAFRKCKYLEEVTISDSVSSVKKNAFLGCSSLKSINVDSNNSFFCSQDGVLYNKNCTTLIQYPAGKSNTEYSVTDSVTSISSNAFRGCRGLTEISIPSRVTYIYENAFRGCSSLKNVTIPRSVKSIYGNVFKGCISLEKVYISNVNTWCNIYFSSYDSNPLKYADNLYINGELVSNVEIGESVDVIPEYAFSCQNITSVQIPKSVTSIGYRAFYGCVNLSQVKYTGTDREWNFIEIAYGNSWLTNILPQYGEVNSDKASPLPTVTPDATVSATAPTVASTTEPTSAPSASAKPTTEPTAEPTKQPDVKKSIKFTKKSVKINKGKKITLKVKITGAKKAKFTTNKKKVAKIVKAKAKKVTIKGMRKGKAVITAKAAGKKAKCKVTVK